MRFQVAGKTTEPLLPEGDCMRVQSRALEFPNLSGLFPGTIDHSFLLLDVCIFTNGA